MRSLLGRRAFFAAFGVRGFAWLWLSTLLYWTGWIVGNLAQGWLVLTLTDSPLWVGLGVGVRGACQTLFSVPAGALADRLDRRTVLLLSHALAALTAAVTGWLVLVGAIQVWHALFYLGVTGMLTASERTAIGALFYDVVGPVRMMNAAALRFMGSSFTGILASLAGGAVLHWLGVGSTFLLSAAIFLAGAVDLIMVRSSKTSPRTRETFARSMALGLDYAARTHHVRNLLLLSLVVEGVGFAYLAMMPVVARDVLGIGGLGLGYLMAAAGLGQLMATVFLASHSDVRSPIQVLIVAALGFGLFIALVGFSRSVALSLVLVMSAHIFGSTYDINIFTALPRAASDAMRGRVLGLFAATLGFSQIGAFFIGAVATVVGAPLAVTVNGTLTVLGTLALLPGLQQIRLPGAEIDRGGAGHGATAAHSPDGRES